MTLLLVIIFVISLIAMWLDKPNFIIDKNISVFGVIIISITLALLASIRPDNMPDYRAYLRIYDTPQYQINERIELGFIWFILVFKHFIADDFIKFLFFAAFISVLIKLLAVKNFSSLFFTSLYVYIASKFISNDLIQMRVAFSTGLFLLAVYYKFNNKLFKFLIAATIAFFFHYSAILVYLVWFIPTKKINKTIWILAVLVSYVLALTGFSVIYLISYIPVEGLQNLYIHYSEIEQTGANLLSILLISKLIICIYFLIKWDKYAKNSPYFVIVVKLFAISLIAYCLLFSINAVAVRIAELFQIVEIVLIPFLYYISKRRIIGKSLITIIGLIYFIFYVNFSGWFSN